MTLQGASMNVGTLGYTVRSGIGLLIKRFYEHNVVNRLLRIPHRQYQDCCDLWYNNERGRRDLYGDIPFLRGTSDAKYADDFLDGLDLLLLFENAWQYWDVVKVAASYRIPIVMMPMYEFTPPRLPVKMDLYLCPSDLDMRVYQAKGSCTSIRCERLNVPVEVEWKLRHRAKVFIHNAGHGGASFRNGTPDVINAIKFVNNNVEFIIRAQPDSLEMRKLFERTDFKLKKTGPQNVRLKLGNIPDCELWDEGDVFLFPEAFNGLSLPLQEAFAAGMLVMAGARFPMTAWLPNDPLIPVDYYKRQQILIDVDRACYSPQKIAETIDAWAHKNIEMYSHMGKAWAEANSWEALGPKYLNLFEDVIKAKKGAAACRSS